LDSFSYSITDTRYFFPGERCVNWNLSRLIPFGYGIKSSASFNIGHLLQMASLTNVFPTVTRPSIFPIEPGQASWYKLRPVQPDNISTNLIRREANTARFVHHSNHEISLHRCSSYISSSVLLQKDVLQTFFGKFNNIIQEFSIINSAEKRDFSLLERITFIIGRRISC